MSPSTWKASTFLAVCGCAWTWNRLRAVRRARRSSTWPRAEVGNRVRFGGLGLLGFRRRAAYLGAEGPVAVWYDPANPGISVLEPGVSAALRVELAFAVGTMLAGLGWLAAALAA